jgi:hypothetical protein
MNSVRSSGRNINYPEDWGPEDILWWKGFSICPECGETFRNEDMVRYEGSEMCRECREKFMQGEEFYNDNENETK